VRPILKMSKGKNKGYLFNVTGVLVVAVWLVMLGLLIKNNQFKNDRTAVTNEKSVIPIKDVQRDWKEIFLKDKKVGYTVSLLKPFKGGYFIQEEIFLRLNLMGMDRPVYTMTQTRVDERFFLRSFNFKMTSGIVQFFFTGQMDGDRLLVKTGMGKKQRTQVIQLTKPPMMGAGLGYFFKSRKIQVGETFTMPVFDPTTMSQKETVIRVAAKEPLTINRITYQAFRLETEMLNRQMTFWLDQDGTTLKEEGFMGLTTIKSSAANAPLAIEVGPNEDFYEIVAVTLDKALPNPTRLRYLKLRIHGIEDSFEPPLIEESDRQTFHQDIIEIHKEKPPYIADYTLSNPEFGPKLQPFLEPEFNIESDDEEIIEKTRQIVGEDQNPISVARKLLRWVYNHIEKKPVLSIPSASEVLKTRAGDCNEHATLLTAMLRAAGIPARLNVGLVYTRDKFFYHAWTEAYIGRWISMDPTLNQLPADVGHIRLVRGNLDQQVAIVALIGKIKLELLDYQYD
jgi:hypothetical protein